MAHLIAAGIVLLLVIILQVVIHRGSTGKGWWRSIGVTVGGLIVVLVIGGLDWPALFRLVVHH